MYRVIPPIVPLTSDASMFRAPQWHGATQTHFPPRPRKSPWRSDITGVISTHRVSQTHPAHQRHAAFTPACFALPRSMFRAPQWHGATQTHFPPRPCASAWHCDITDVISPRGAVPRGSLVRNAQFWRLGASLVELDSDVASANVVRERAFRSWTQKWPVCSANVVRERAYRSWKLDSEVASP